MLLLLVVLLIDDGGDKDTTAAAVAAVGSADVIGCAVGGVVVACFVVHVHEYVNIAWNNLN